MEAGVTIDRIVTDEAWAAVAPLLPGKQGDPGCSARDNRLFLEAVLWIARTGAPWRDLPGEFGKWYTTYTRYNRWEKRGVWPRVVEELQARGAHELSYDRTGLRWASAPAVVRPGPRPASKAAAA
ncbi:MAG: hypothetical protein CTY15_08650 [Methylocystis sp.]|nr:MAG: hypothetical protein CTY15_08650 [Methylocystis sp.]